MTVAGFRRARYARPLVVILASLLLRSTVIHANDVTPPAPPPPRPAIVGFVDTHLHQFANLGFGGLDVWGSPMDPSLDPNAPLETARARALPNSDFIYVPMSEASDYLYIADTPVIGSPAAEVCSDGSCWPECPAGTGVAANACVRIRIHGAGGTEDLLNEMVPNGSPEHGVLGYPDMQGWPAFDVLTTQQAYWEWLQRAHDHGMKLIVMLAVNNQVLCQAAVHRASYGCGDDGAVSRQIQGAKDLETYIDARAGGPGQGFYKIVRSSDEARTAIQNGKLAVVLGTEVDTAWGCTPGSTVCNDEFIQARVQDYYDAGIRVVYPVHLVDNKFGGTALYTGLFELSNFLVNGGAWFDMGTCGDPLEWRSDVRDIISTAKDVVVAAMIGIVAAGPLVLIPLTIALTALPLLGLFAPVVGPVLGGTVGFLTFIGAPIVLAVATVLILEAPGKVGDAPVGNCNNRGLTAEGSTLINALMDHKMIIDVDHTDGHTFDAIMDLAETRHYPGMVSGHTGLVGASLTRDEVTAMGMTFHASESGRHEANKTDEQVQRVLGVGGFLSLGLGGGGRAQVRDFSGSDDVAFNCGRSSQAFAQQYLYATQTLGVTAVGFGSDINGFAGFPTPRYGSKACNGDFPGGYDPNSSEGRLDYATATDYYGAPFGQYTFGNKTWDFNTEGFAHAGLYPDFIADLGANNLSNADLAPLFNGAEAYVRMWEKIDDVAAPTVRCGTVGEDWHADDVTVPCLSYDFGWGLADAAHANFSVATSVPDGTETDNASTATHTAICDAAPSAHCTDVIPAISGINVDKKDPTVTVSVPAAGTPAYLLNQVVTANYGCADGGSGVDDCTGTVASGAVIDTASVGTHAFSVTGSDNVGHVVTVAQPYNVSFNVCVLFDQTKAHRAGSAVPIKLTVCDAAGANVSSSAIVLTATGVTQLSTSAPGVLEDAGNANPDHAFRFDSGAYVFNLKTTGMSTGTYALTFTATGDPVPHLVQFQIR